MKKNRFITALFAALIALSAAPSAFADHLQLPERVFAPIGFDSNDDAQVVLYGHFPDSCYQAGPATAVVRGREIRVRNLASRSDSPGCVTATVPWTTTVHLGSLAEGRYRVFVESSGGRAIEYAQLEVFHAITSRADDYLYAYVNGAIVNQAKRPPVLTISGSFNLTCMEIAKIRVRENSGTIVVQPIVRLRKDEVCAHPFAPIPFTASVTLQPRTREATLIHIRSMNGQALNQVIEN